MKRKVWSLLLTLALCLSLLPAAAFAEDGGSESGESAKNVVSVTVGDVTTEYSNIFRAFESVKNASSATIKLLDDVYLPEDENEGFEGFPGKIKFESSGSVTLDLNGHLLTQANIGFTDGYTPNVIEMLYGTLTITGEGTIYQRYKTSALSVSSQSELTIDSDGVTVKADFTYGSHQFETDSSRAIAITGGTLEIRGGTFTATSGVALEYTSGTVLLSGGTFNGIKILTYKYPGKINEGVTIVDLLAPGYTYQNTDGTALEDYYVQTISDVQVVEGLVPVPYVDADGNAATATNYIQIEPDKKEWTGGTYVVRGDVTIDGNVTVTGAMPSIILCDRASLTVNGGITLPEGSSDPLTIYGQTGGTGKMTVTNGSGAAFSCPSNGLAMLRLLNGTLTATGKDKAFSNVITWNQAYGNDGIKCVATGSETETWVDGKAVPSVTLSRCTEHQWSYEQHKSAEQHLKTCALCLYNPNGAGVYENCVYDTCYGADESGHKKACVCHRTKPGAAPVEHTPKYIPNADGKTHGYRCEVCDFVSDATAIDHSYVGGVCSACGYVCPHEDIDRTIGSATEGVCGACGERVYVARLVADEGKTVEYAATVAEALVRYKNGGPIVTLLCDVDMGTEALVVTYEIAGKELDLNGYTLSGSGDAVFQINKRYGFTLHNGTVENTGDGDAVQLIHGVDPSWGGTYSDGELTLKDITVTAFKGWAIRVAEDASYADLYIKSGTFTGGLNAGTISGGHKVQISGGTFIANTDTHSIYYPGSSLSETMLVGRLKDMLAGGWTYGDADRNAINYFAAENRTIVGKSRYNYPEGVYLNATTVTIVEHTFHPIDRETKKCSICGAPCTHIETDKNGICTACGDRVMFCEAEGTLYQTIQAAQETLKDRTDNPVIKLLDNYGFDTTLLGTANGYTLDLNGFKLTDGQTILYENRNLTITDSSEAKTGSVGTLWASKGHATIQDGIFAELIASEADSIRITGEGTVKIRKISMTGYTNGSNKKVVADLLAPGYAVYLVDENAGTQTLVNGYYNKNNIGNLQQYLPGDYKDSTAVLPDGQYYTVKPHEHSYADSTVTTCECGKICTHDTVDAYGKCAGCGKVFTASVTDSGKTVYYADGTFTGGNTRSGLDVAFEKAEAGSTVTLLGGSSVTGWLDGGKTLTLELNGKTVGYLYIGQKEGINALNITGTGDIGGLYVHADNTAILTGWTGKMDLLYVYDGGKVTLSAGTVAGFGGSAGTAGSVLAAGRAFQKADGSLVEYGTALSALENVTAVACPDTVIEIGHCVYCNKTVAAMVNGTAYNDFDSAVTAWLESGGTMTLYKSVDDMTTATWQGDGKTYTLDLNGCVLTAPDDDSGSPGPTYQIMVTDMNLTVQDTSDAAEGQIDNLRLSENTTLTLKSGWLGRPTVPEDDTVHVTLEGGGLKGYDVKVPLAYLLPDGYDLEGVPNLYSSGTSGLTATVRKAPLSIGGEKQGTMPFGRNRLPFAPTAALDAGAETPATITAAWYKRDGTPLTSAEMKPSGTGYLYDSASGGAGFESYDGMTVGDKYDLFMVLTATDDNGAELWQAAVTGYELSVGLPTLDDAEIAFTGGSEAVFDPDGSTNVPAFTVTLYGDTVNAAHYTVIGETADGVGTYTVTVKGDGVNCVGSKSAQWTVRAHRLGGMELSSATRQYDGTTAVPGDVFTGVFRSAEDGAPVMLAAGDYRITAASYNSADVGGGKTVTYTVELLNKNYTFADGTTQTFRAQTEDLLKADAPAAEPVTLTVYNSQDKIYAIALPALPTLADGCEYGDTAYGEPVVAMTVSGYYSEGAVLGNGKQLILPILKNDVDTTGAVGTVQVTVTTANYKDITLTVNVVAANKIVPVLGSVSASAITYGEALSASALTGAMQDGVQGEFAWTNSLYKPAAGKLYEAEWKFTPTGDDAYKYAATTGKVTVEVRKATMSAIVEQYLTLTYDGTPQVADINCHVNTADRAMKPEFTYAAAESGPYTAEVPAFTNAGSYTVYFRAMDPSGNHEPVSGSFTVTVDPKTVTDPTIALRGDFTYTGEAIEPAVTVKDSETEIPAGEYTVSFRGNVNAGTAAVIVTDVAGGNYIVSGSTTFEIAKADQTFSAEPVTAVYGDMDAKVTYTGTVYGAVTYAVKSGGDAAEVDEATGALSLLKSGTAVVTVIAAGDANHNRAERDVTVTVQKATLTIRALDRSAYTGSAAPDLSAPALDRDYVIEGLLGSDTVVVEDVRMSYDPEPDMTETGEYGILITGDLSADERYEPDFVSGTLAVTALPTYPINVPDGTENGSVSVRPKRASRGDTVTITVEPDEGFELDELVVTDKDGNELRLTDRGGGKYSFTMPGGRVEIKASFKKLVEISPFDDVNTDAYYYEAVKWAAENGIAAGIGDHLFGPDQSCTRAQIVTFLWRAAGSPEPESESGFADVPADSFYAKAGAWAVENGITNGTGGGRFSPDATCTRAQGVTLLLRAAEASAEGAPAFTDVAADAYYAEAVKWALDRGITSGIGNGLFGPDNACTREQIVTFLWRLHAER